MTNSSPENSLEAHPRCLNAYEGLREAEDAPGIISFTNENQQHHSHLNQDYQQSHSYTEPNSKQPLSCGSTRRSSPSSSSSSSVAAAVSAAIPTSRTTKPEKPPTHVKKPLNAFMLFMKEMRAKVVAECTMKESAAVNQILGRRWHALSRQEQSKFYEMARQEKELHQRLHPGWSARDNYAYHAKKRKARHRCCPPLEGDDTPVIQRKVARDCAFPMNPNNRMKVTENPVDLATMERLVERTTTTTTNADYNKSPFSVGWQAHTRGATRSSLSSAVEEDSPYFSLLERKYYQQQQQQTPRLEYPPPQHSAWQSAQQGDIRSHLKETSSSYRLANSLSNSPGSVSSMQHFQTIPNWTQGSQQVRQSDYEKGNGALSVTASLWSLTPSHIDDHHHHRHHHHHHRNRQSNCVHSMHPYSTPPYNPNGKFDCPYVQHDVPNYPTVPQNTLAPAISSVNTDQHTKNVISYKSILKKAASQSDVDGGIPQV